MGKTFKDSKYRPENEVKKKKAGKKGEKAINKKKARGATKTELRKFM